MNEEPEQQSEWRRRITESMAATTYEQLKALVEGVSNGFDEVQASFAALEGRLQKIELAANDSRMAFGHEAELVRTSLGEHANAVTERVEHASAEMVKDLSDRSQELSAQLAALGEEMSARLTDLHTAQQGELTRSRSELTEAATSISARVEAAIAGLSQEMRSQWEATTAAVGASAAATSADLKRMTDAIAAIERLTQEVAARAQDKSAQLDQELSTLAGEIRSSRDALLTAVETSGRPLATAIDALKGALKEARDQDAARGGEYEAKLGQLAERLDVATQRQLRETAAAVGELKAAVTDHISGRLEDVSARMASSGEIAAALRDVLQEQPKDAATRWDDLVGQLAARRWGGRAEGDDVAIVALIRALEKILDARDQRFLAFLDETARAMPARRRAPFLRRAKTSLQPGQDDR